MPFIRTALPKDTRPDSIRQVVEGIHRALVVGIGMPESELFNLVERYDSDDFHYSRTFNGIARSDKLIVIEITLRRGRSDAMKRSLYAAICTNLGAVGIRPQDIFIFMHENDYSDWSVGNGVFAMNIVQQPGSDV